MNLYIVQIDPFDNDNITPANVNDIHKHILDNNKDSTLTINDVNDILMSNGSIYWDDYVRTRSYTIQYTAIDIDKTFDNDYENNIVADIKTILRDNKLNLIV